MQTGAQATPTDGWIPVDACGACGSPRAQEAGTALGVRLFRCRECGLIRAQGVEPPDTVYVDGYHTGVVDPTFSYLEPRTVEYETTNANRRLDLLERFARPGRLLDVGGGVGTFCAAAARRGWSPTLVEPVSEAVAHARARGIPSVVGGVADLDSAGGPFDVAALVHVLEHLPEARDALERVRDVLRPGGLLLVEVPNFGSVCRRASGDRWYHWRLGQHVHFFTRRTLRRLLRAAGFEVLSARTMVLAWDGLPLPHYAHILGLEGALSRAVAIRRRLRPAGPSAEADSHGAIPPLREDRPLHRALSPALRAVARIEEALGTGESLIAIARVQRQGGAPSGS